MRKEETILEFWSISDIIVVRYIILSRKNVSLNSENNIVEEQP